MPQKMHTKRGTTLIELMIAVTLLSIIGIGFAGVFANIGKAIQFSKTKALASNLAQERIQILKQKSFNKVLVTTSSLNIPSLTPSIPYDPYYYPPENILEGSIQFTRYTYVQVADENSGVLQYYGAIPDTGMKLITVTVVWNQGVEVKKLQLRSVMSNIDTTMMNCAFTGTITNSAGGAGISGALVTIAENVGYRDTANASGVYTINLSPGSYSMYASASGFYGQYRDVSITGNQTSTQSFALNAIGTGTIRGTVWINSHPVISQIVASTATSSGFCQEYVEVFNPSTWTWTMGVGASANVQLAYAHYGDSGPTFIPMTYVVSTVDPGHYYLFANTTTIRAGGVTKTADAVYQNSALNAIYSHGGACGGSADADAVGIIDISGTDLDIVGWTDSGSGHLPPGSEGTAITQATMFLDQTQFVRRTSTSGVTAGIGRAYDSNTNNTDFVVSATFAYPVHNSLDAAEPIVSGTPANGAYVTANDGLSTVTIATATGNPPVAQFFLNGVSTGIWSVFVTSSSYFAEIDTVTITQNTTIYITTSTTVPAWPATGYNVVKLSSAATQGYVAGTVLNDNGAAISGGIRVSAGGTSYTQSNSATGRYLLPLGEGTYDITANPDNFNSSYISVTSQTVPVVLGEVKSNVNFVVSQGGRIRGFVTRDGINALSNVAFAAFDVNDVARDQEVSSSNGYFTLTNLATGTYRVEPVLDTGESASPTYVSTTVTAGSLVSVGTFTITGTFGTIRGTVTENSNPIRVGVLVLVSTRTIVSLPNLSAATLTGASYYLTNSYEDGTYAIDVRGSTTTTYNMYAYYTTFNGNIPSVSTRSLTSVTVTAGSTTYNKNFTW